MLSYAYEVITTKNKATGYDFPTLIIRLKVRRLTPFYSVTVVLPVIFVVVIANLGLVIPGMYQFFTPTFFIFIHQFILHQKF